MNYKVISADDHVVEPPDVFQRRLPERLKSKAPEIKRFGDVDRWVIGERVLAAAGSNKSNIKTVYEKRGTLKPTNYDTCEPGIWLPDARLLDYDSDGKDGAVLFPDFFPGFTGDPFWSLKFDPELRLECLKVWNDWLMKDFCSVNPERLIPLCLLPVWDIDESVKELERCAKLGYRGFIFAGVLDIFGYPTFFEPHWDRLWQAAQDADMVMALHQQSAQLDRKNEYRPNGWTDEDKKNLPGLALATGIWHLSTNLIPLIDILACGMLERFPKLRLMLGESGVGWIPYVIGQSDFCWEHNLNNSMGTPRSPLTMYPSQIWKRQCSATFWKERIDDYVIEELGEDNVMWEDDYPHQPSNNGVHGGSPAYIEYSLQRVTDPRLRQKLLADNVLNWFNIKT